MALGTPVAAAAAYSAAAGTTVAPAYPTGITAGDVLVMFVGMKPSTANSGTVTTPTGWTLRDSLTAAGGYGTTIGADTGNTNLYVYTKDTVTGSETGTLSVTLGTNNVTWAFIVRIPDSGGTISYGSADGQRTTTPTSPMSIALTNGATATNFQAGDIAIWAMCIPTDVTTPSQFSAQSITATGATFGTAAELNEPDSTTGNDIGGYSAWASVTAGSSTTAPTVTATLAGTLTNVRGPVVLLRVRETVVNVTHDTSGTLTGQIGSVAGTAQHNIPHATSGVLDGQTATITGAADREAAAIPHTTEGALTGPGAVIDGAATRFRAHATSGTLPGQTSAVAGSANRTLQHDTSGALPGQSSALAGSASRTRQHAATGALSGQSAAVIGSASRFRAFSTSGALSGGVASIVGAAERTGNTTEHATTGALAGSGAIIAGAAASPLQQQAEVAPYGFSVKRPTQADIRRERERLGILPKQARRITTAVKAAVKAAESPAEAAQIAQEALIDAGAWDSAMRELIERMTAFYAWDWQRRQQANERHARELVQRQIEEQDIAFVAMLMAA